MSPIDSDWNVVFGFAGDSTGVAANALSIVYDESEIDHGKTSRVGDGLVTRCRTLIVTQVHNIHSAIRLIVASGFASYLQDYLQHSSNSRLVNNQPNSRPTIAPPANQAPRADPKLPSAVTRSTRPTRFL